MTGLYSERARQWAKQNPYCLTPEIRSNYLQKTDQNTYDCADLNSVFRKRVELKQGPIEIWGEIASVHNSTKLVSVHYSGNLKSPEEVFLASLCHLAKNKDRMALIKLSAKEIEAFLRDQNHLPALYEASEHPPEWMTALLQVQSEMIYQLLVFDGAQETAKTSDIFGPELLTESPTLAQKLRMVESFLEQKIRPPLKQDGGDVAVTAVDWKAGVLHLFLDFKGACASCLSSKKGTWQYLINQFDKYFKGKIELHLS